MKVSRLDGKPAMGARRRAALPVTDVRLDGASEWWRRYLANHLELGHVVTVLAKGGVPAAGGEHPGGDVDAIDGSGTYAPYGRTWRAARGTSPRPCRASRSTRWPIRQSQPHSEVGGHLGRSHPGKSGGRAHSPLDVADGVLLLKAEGCRKPRDSIAAAQTAGGREHSPSLSRRRSRCRSHLGRQHEPVAAPHGRPLSGRVARVSPCRPIGRTPLRQTHSIVVPSHDGNNENTGLERRRAWEEPRAVCARREVMRRRRARRLLVVGGWRALPAVRSSVGGGTPGGSAPGGSLLVVRVR